MDNFGNWVRTIMKYAFHILLAILLLVIGIAIAVAVAFAAVYLMALFISAV